MAINNQTPVGAPVTPKIAPTSAVSVSKVNQKVQGGGGLLNVILIIVLVGLGVFGTILFFDKGNVLNHTSQLENEITSLKTEIATYKSQKVEVSKNAQDILSKIKENEVQWSEVIAEVNKLLPLDTNGQKKVQVISYSGSESGRIALNIVTNPAGVPPYDVVSGVISTFNNSIFFKNAYVPSISKGQTEIGETTLSFVLNFEYQKPETGTADIDLGLTPTTSPISTSTTESTVKVPVSTNTPKIPTPNN